MKEAPKTQINDKESVFWCAARVKLIIQCALVISLATISSYFGVQLTKRIEIYPTELFLYIHLAAPIVASVYVGVREKVHPYKVTAILAAIWSLATYCLTFATSDSNLVTHIGVILAFVKEGVFYGVLMLLITFISNKIVMRSNA